jgi:tRNA1(Val) A37 N6-methylase TrmN6
MEKMTFEEKSVIYEKSLDDDFKKNHGIFYTDSKLSLAMIDYLNIPKDSSVIDPCCGTGSFVDALQSRGYEQVYGCDFDEKTVRKCRALTQSKKIQKIDTLGLDGIDVLKKVKHSQFDYVIGNPPYAPLGKDVNIDCTIEFDNKVRNSGSNLFVAAIYRSFELASEDGTISFIIPKNLLHISSYKLMREKLLKEKTIVSIIELGIHFKTVRGEQVILTMKNHYESDNKIQFGTYKDGEISFMSEVTQDYYDDEIIVFTDNEEVPIYDKLRESYGQLSEVCAETIRRGRDKSDDAIRGKQIRKFGFKDQKLPDEGNQIFIQNIFSAEAGITASFGGNLKSSETVTIVKLENTKMCKYVLGLLHSRVCNYFLIRFGFNNSRLTIHTDAKYLNDIPIVVDDDAFEKVVEIVNKMESVTYMEEDWYKLNEELNDLVYNIYQLNVKDKDHIEKEMRKISAGKWYMDKTTSA